MKCKTWFCF